MSARRRRPSLPRSRRARDPAPSPRSSSRCWRHRGARRSTATTGSSSRSGTATGSRRSLRRGRWSSARATGMTPAATSRSSWARRPGSRHPRRSWTAKSSPSMTTGRPDFGLLQARLGGGFSSSDLPASPEAKTAGKHAPLVFMAFDLPWCAGRSYVDVPLEERKEILRLVLREHPRVRYGGPRGPGRRRILRGRGGPGPRGRDGQAPPEPLRSGPPLDGMAQAQGSAHAGAGRGRIRPGPGEPPRPRRACRRGDGGRPAPVRRARGERHSTTRPGRASGRRSTRGRARITRSTTRPPDLAATADATWAAPDLVIRAEIGGWSRDGIVRQATFAQEAPEVDPVSVERQVAVGPEAAARAMAKAGVGPVRHAAATHPVNKPNGSRLSKDEVGRDAKPPVRAAGRAADGGRAGRARRAARAGRDLADRRPRRGPDEPRQGPGPRRGRGRPGAARDQRGTRGQ